MRSEAPPKRRRLDVPAILAVMIELDQLLEIDHYGECFSAVRSGQHPFKSIIVQPKRGKSNLLHNELGSFCQGSNYMNAILTWRFLLYPFFVFFLDVLTFGRFGRSVLVCGSLQLVAGFCGRVAAFLRACCVRF